jgi:beta-glucosidase
MMTRRLVVVLALLAASYVHAQSTEPALHKPGQFSAYDDIANELLGRMTLAEKVGQMTQPDLQYLGDLSDIRKLAVGSVLSGGNSDPKDGNSPEAWARVNDACQREALATRLGVPILYGVDAVHGHSNVIGAVIFPHNIGLGCTRDPALVEEVHRVTAIEMRRTGVNWDFAPCVTVPQDDRWGRTYEGFGESPALATLLGAAAVSGLQGSDLADPLRVLGCAKHFVGDGGTEAEQRETSSDQFGAGVRLRLDQGDTRIDEPTLRRVHLAPYPAAIAAGVGTIMPSYSSWNGEKCSASHYLLTEVLKEELGFEGFLISDYNAIDQVADDYKECIRLSINAGMDMVMVPERYREFITKLTELVNEGAVPMERIDDAVRRILRVKAAMGLLGPDPVVLSNKDLASSFGSEPHREVARRAVRQSLVLLKNDGVLPLSKGSFSVSGSAADDLGVQCGGWTIDWQGKVGDVTTGGTTISDALTSAAGERVVAEAGEADAIVLVVGEKPYAEGTGDVDEPKLSDEDQSAVEAALATGKPVVLVVVSGRPLLLGDAVDKCAAVVAAWLPGTEGAGVADVLLGDYPPTGKLSFSWPKSAGQHPINVGDNDYDPLFPYGYGLTY